MVAAAEEEGGHGGASARSGELSGKGETERGESGRETGEEGEDLGASTALEGARASSSVAWKQEVAPGMLCALHAAACVLGEEDKASSGGLGRHVEGGLRL